MFWLTEHRCPSCHRDENYSKGWGCVNTVFHYFVGLGKAVVSCWSLLGNVFLITRYQSLSKWNFSAEINVVQSNNNDWRQKMKRTTLFLFLLISLLLVACGSSAENSTASSAPVPAMDVAYEESVEFDNFGDAEAPELVIGRNDLAQTQRLIIKSGNMSIEVKDIDLATSDATNFILGLGGYIVNQDVSGYDNRRNATLTLAVPVANFEETLAAFRQYGVVNSESASGQDVTEEYVDLNSRLENLLATQTRLRELFDAAQNVEETLEVDRELRQIEGEINVIQGRIKFLSERASFSTITLNLFSTSEQPLGQPEGWNIGDTFSRAFGDLADGATVFIDGLIYFSIAILPFLLILLLIAWIVWRVFRRIFRSRPQQSRRTVNEPPQAVANESDNA